MAASVMGLRTGSNLEDGTPRNEARREVVPTWRRVVSDSRGLASRRGEDFCTRASVGLTCGTTEAGLAKTHDRSDDHNRRLGLPHGGAGFADPRRQLAHGRPRRPGAL